MHKNHQKIQFAYSHISPLRWSVKRTPTTRINLKFNQLNDGVYILKVKTTIGTQTFKIINHE